jgi:UDP-3-O-[3-hydroxymyristoyl] glucosamine N-acyltransferase
MAKPTPIQKSLSDIAELIHGTVEGDGSAIISGVAGIKEAGPGDITFVGNQKFLPMLSTTRASAVIVDYNAPACDTNLVRTDHPYLAFTQVLKLFAVELPTPKGIHPSSIVAEDAVLGKDVALHAGVVVGSRCQIGDRTLLYPGVFVGRRAEIGADCMIYPRVAIFHDVLIGNNVIIHSGAVVGSRPRPDDMRTADDIEHAVQGTVVIEDDVEIGASVTIDAACTGTTIIGRGTKIDNLVHIGSDSAVGNNCIIVSQAGVGSHCTIGNNVTIAGQAGILDGVTVGDGTIIAARAGVTEDLGVNQIISGFPAMTHEKWLRIYASIKRLPTIVKDVRDFKKRLSTPEELADAEPEDH